MPIFKNQNSAVNTLSDECSRDKLVRNVNHPFQLPDMETMDPLTSRSSSSWIPGGGILQILGIRSLTSSNPSPLLLGIGAAIGKLGEGIAPWKRKHPGLLVVHNEFSIGGSVNYQLNLKVKRWQVGKPSSSLWQRLHSVTK